MLGFISGKVAAKNEDNRSCVVVTHGVGYEVIVPEPVFDTLALDGETSLWLHTHVREDQLVLFGFAAESEKNLFRVLLGVSGLGPKTAMSLLTEHGASRLVQHIIRKDADAIAEASGVGKKLAQKLILDLASKMEKLAWLDTMPKVPSERHLEAASPARRLRDDLSSALSHLGYQPKHVDSVLEQLFGDEAFESKGFETCLKAALKDLSGRTLGSGIHRGSAEANVHD